MTRSVPYFSKKQIIMKKMVFIGAGSYGTAVANHVAEKHKDSAHVLIYGRDKKTVDEINLNHRNTKYLPRNELSKHLKSTSDLGEAVTGADYIFMGIPAQHVRKMTSQIRNYVMQPYKLVKDLRTGHETGNVQAVMDGEIDDFIKAYLMELGKQ